MKDRGCTGNSFHLEYATEAKKFDEVINQHGVTVIVDSAALMRVLVRILPATQLAIALAYEGFRVFLSLIVSHHELPLLQHSTMDFMEEDETEGFVFENPQAKGTCGCGESFIV